MTRRRFGSRGVALVSASLGALGLAWGCSSPSRDFDSSAAGGGSDAGGQAGDSAAGAGKAGKGGATSTPCGTGKAGACSEDAGSGAGGSSDAGAGGESGGIDNGGAPAGGMSGSAGSSAGAPACTVGTEGCACSAGGVCSGALICRGTQCAKVVCGDKRVEGAEVCDDGNNFGTAVGDCAPDCSVLVVQKKIVQSAAGVAANFAKGGAGSTPQTADAYCPPGYKALFADGQFRVASVSPNKGDGQLQWVLSPWTRYVNSASQLIWLTQTVRLLGVSGGVFKGLTNPIVPGSNSGYLTGMNTDWTALAAGRNCGTWASIASATQGMIGIGGSSTGTFLEQAHDFTYPCNDTTNWRLYCVEQ